MTKNNRFSNRIAFPPVLLSAVAVIAGLDAASTFSRAERELALPRPVRRPAAEIHADVLQATRTAVSLARRAS